MNIWRAFFSVVLAGIISKVTYLQVDFFQYKFYSEGQFVPSSLFIYFLDILLFVLIYAALYFFIPRFLEWRMSAQYNSAQEGKPKES